ncbi:GDSL-type esterase/lipase family protein [Ideonella sp. BN130291]|uniref:GDSL-type esterase/lipase family protein n=1 Tax=Ideonella sp. BN130291 TaxID=3112940 RepID=UPI002E25BAF2|nr:GDSL-type esterase/lipase family protein [Ideonella sp. BN130291]
MTPTLPLVRGGALAAAFAAVLAALSACGSLRTPGTPDELALHVGRLHADLRLQVADFEGQHDFTGSTLALPKPAQPKVPDSQVSARISSKDATGDALTLKWSNAWFASLRFVADKPMDLRPWLPDGTLEFDVEALDMAKAGLTFVMGCGADCGRKLPWQVPSRALQGLGWQHLSFSLQCFARDGNDFSAVTQPFVVDTSGTGEVSVANVRIVKNGKPNASCPDHRTESVTPAPLTQVWSLEWWIPRHEKKLDEIRQLRAQGLQPEVIFIGDSITQGWEDAGKAVWERHYKRYNALDLGFGGDHTENVLWRLQHGEVHGIRPKVAVLMIGTNNTGDRQEDPATTAAGVKRIVEELRQRLPDTKILLLAVFPRDELPTGRMRRLNDRVNAQIAGLHDGQHVHFLNLNAALMNPDGTLSKDILPDLLHLSEKGYVLWAQSMEPTLRKLLSE